MKPKTTLTVAAVIFATVSVLHLWRWVKNLEVLFGTFSFPRWASILGIIVPAYLAYHLFVLRKKS